MRGIFYKYNRISLYTPVVLVCFHHMKCSKDQSLSLFYSERYLENNVTLIGNTLNKKIETEVGILRIC